MATFDKFFSAFKRDEGSRASEAWELDGREVDGFNEMMGLAAGVSFNQGLLRIHSVSSAAKADALVVEAFPEHQSRREGRCFAMDWLGCQYSINTVELNNAGDPRVFLYDVNDGSYFSSPASFIGLFVNELPQYPDDYLNSQLFHNWSQRNPESLPLGVDECVGYAHPLFLGGDDGVDNLEVTDWEVYWGLTGQIRLATSGLGIDTPVDGIDISDP